MLPEQQQQPPRLVQQQQQQQHWQPPPHSEDLQDEQHRQRQEPPQSVPQQQELVEPTPECGSPVAWRSARGRMPPGPTDGEAAVSTTLAPDVAAPEPVLADLLPQCLLGSMQELADALHERVRDLNMREWKLAQQQFQELCRSMHAGDTDAFKERLQTCSPDTQHAIGEGNGSLLHEAMSGSYYKCARMLLQRWPQMMLRKERHGWTPLMVLCAKMPSAASHGAHELGVQMLEDYIAALEEQDDKLFLQSLGWVNREHRTAFHLLAEKGEARTLQKLLGALEKAARKGLVNAEGVLNIPCLHNQTCYDLARRSQGQGVSSCLPKLMELLRAEPPGQVPQTAEGEEEKKEDPWANWRVTSTGSDRAASSWSWGEGWRSSWELGRWHGDSWNGSAGWRGRSPGGVGDNCWRM